MSDTLYHFTAAHLIRSVLEEGLTKGAVPLQFDPPRFDWRWRWLTTSPEFGQSWNQMEMLDYDRTAYRITVQIPSLARQKLYRWTAVGRKIAGDEAYEVLSSRGDPENWVLFKGDVRPQWFTAVDAKEEYPEIELTAHAP